MYKIADFNVNIRYMYPENKAFFADYEIFEDVKEDFFVASTDREIENELKACLALDPPQVHSPMYAERLVILRKLCALLIEYDTFLLHGVVLECEGKGYIITAPSGKPQGANRPDMRCSPCILPFRKTPQEKRRRAHRQYRPKDCLQNCCPYKNHISQNFRQR